MLQKFRLFIIIFLLVLIFLPGFAKLQELRQKLSDTQLQIEKTQRRNALLEDRIARLKNNTEDLEIVAREKMGVVKKGETVLKIVPETPANVTSETGNTSRSFF